MEVRATCDVKAGDELTISYVGLDILILAGQKRRSELLIRREFLCEVGATYALALTSNLMTWASVNVNAIC